MNDDLKSCPFCGGTPKLIDDRTAWYVECQTCEVVVIGPRMTEESIETNTEEDYEKFRSGAVLRWNRRHHEIRPRINPGTITYCDSIGGKGLPPCTPPAYWGTVQYRFTIVPVRYHFDTANPNVMMFDQTEFFAMYMDTKK